MAYRSNDLTNMRPDGSYIQTEHLIDYPEPEPRPDRIISVTLTEAEDEVLKAIFVSLAWPDQEIISERDWDTIVALAKKLGCGDLNQL